VTSPDYSTLRLLWPLLALLIGMGSCLPAVAATAPAAEPISCPGSNLGPALPSPPDRSGLPVVVFARYLDASKTETGEARDNVELFRGDQHLSTELIYFEPEKKVVTIPGKLNYEDDQVWVNGERATYDFSADNGRFYAIDYGLTGTSAHGTAEQIELIGGNTSVLHQLVYSTCPEGRPDWMISARELEIRHDEGFAIARGAKLEFKGVPILYAPYFTFPIDDRRKSGFLYPGFSNTNDNGFEVSIPWYWNIAPNQDFTIEPHYYTSRGAMISGEYRFLTPRTWGEIDFDYMPYDRKTNTARYRYQGEYNARPWTRWNARLVLDRVGDDDYFQDFGTSIYQTSRQFLRSSATMLGVGRYWNVELMADDYQVIDDNVLPENEPYSRVPRVAFWMDRPFGRSGSAFKIDSELVYFDRSAGTTGARIDLLPSFYWQHFTHWGFIKPSIGYRYTAYDLDRVDNLQDPTPTRGTPIASLDTGLYFDRTNSDGSLQSLEPRLFYLYVPYRDQDDLPRFDTAAYTFGFSQLFNTDRFTGADRQSDANQVALAVSTRNYDAASGELRWSFNVGQIFYFKTLKVQLDGNDEAFTEDISPFIAEFNWHPFTRFSARTGVQWDWERDELDVGSVGFSYTGSEGKRASFDYRYRRDRVDQFDFRVFWPVNDQWRVLSRVNYSFSDDDLLEFQAGIEYESCCWAVRTVVRRYLKNHDGDFRDGIYLELNLKGLASIGTHTQDLFNY